MSKYRIKMDGKIYEIEVERVAENSVSVNDAKPVTQTQSVQTPAPEAKSGAVLSQQTKDGNVVNSPMPGTILKVFAIVGETVNVGQPLLVLEAMKMENEITAPITGKVTELYVNPGDVVQGGAALVKIDG